MKKRAIRWTWDERTFTAIYDPAKHRTAEDTIAKEQLEAARRSTREGGLLRYT